MNHHGFAKSYLAAKCSEYGRTLSRSDTRNYVSNLTFVGDASLDAVMHCCEGRSYKLRSPAASKFLTAPAPRRKMGG